MVTSTVDDFFVCVCVSASDSLKSDISLVHEIALKRKFSVEFEVRWLRTLRCLH